jgi:hypothetical protein
MRLQTDREIVRESVRSCLENIQLNDSFPDGTSNLHHAISNLEAVKIHISDPQDIKMLESLAEHVVGARGTEEYLKQGFENHE